MPEIPAPDLTPLWEPAPDSASVEPLRRLVRLINSRHEANLTPDYRSLQAWSVQHPGEFWAAVWDDTQITGERGERLVETGDALPATRFLPDATFNAAEVLLSRRGEDLAVLYVGEDGETESYTWDELRALVATIQAALRADGVQAGDHVAAIVSNRPMAYALMMATVSLGAVFTSVSPDFGVTGILDRFSLVEPVVLVAVGHYPYGGKIHDITATVKTVTEAMPSVRRTVIVTGAGPRAAEQIIPSSMTAWDTWIGEVTPGAEPSFERFSFDQPMYVLYSSGTTGRPKGIVHRAGGILLKHLSEHQYTAGIQPGDRVCYYTTAGWMMWNWLASTLASGATLVLYEGSPLNPPTRLFDLVDEHQITHLGVSPRFLDSVAEAGLRPVDTHDLSSLTTLFVTGSPLAAERFGWVYQNIAADLALQVISGGTDLCGVLIGPDPTGPLYAGQMAAPALGIDLDVVRPDGTPTEVGERGELVVRAAFPSTPLRFVADPTGERYQAAYFDRFPGLWHHGDFAERTPEGGWVISGRSDATLNPHGVRIGTADLYGQVNALPGVLESLAIGQRVGNDERIVLFVQMAEGHELDEEFVALIKRQIRSNLTPRHVPAVILPAPDLPRTRSGKLSETAVRDQVAGRPVANTSALANPDSLDYFLDLPELKVSP